MSLPNECLALLVQWVASQGAQDLFPLLCVNKRFFYLVVPLLYRDPFRLSARWVRKRCFYKGVIERQTKLIRTLLLCCTRTINKVTPIDPESEVKKNKLGFLTDKSLGRVLTGTRRDEKEGPLTITLRTSLASRAPVAPYMEGSVERNDRQRDSVISSQASSSNLARNTSGTRPRVDSDDGDINEGSGHSSASVAAMMRNAEHKYSDRSIFKSLFHKLGNAYRPEGHADNLPIRNGLKLKSQSHHTRIEQIPVVWDGERQQAETRHIPGLGKPNSPNYPKLAFPLELTKTIIRLSSEPPPMVNYLSYVTHTDVRSWSAASNMTLVHQILGDARPSWHVRLQGFMKKTSRRILGKHMTPDQLGGNGAGTPIYNNRHDFDDFGDDDEDGMDMAFGFRHSSRYRRWRRGRAKRNKNLWDVRDVDFLELLLLFYTSAKMESLSLGMNCSHWYHPSLNVLLPGIPERLSGLRRIVIDHADTIVHNAVPVPQLFIQRHQKEFPGQLREIQVRQSYHYSYDMSKSVLQTIKTMDRLEVLDLSTWTGVFSGLETICTDHLRKLLICHDMDVPRPEMFDELLTQCMVLEELSIIVPHPQLFSWAVERKREEESQEAGMTSRAHLRRSLLSIRSEDSQICRSVNLPPLKNVTLFGHTPDVVAAFKDVIFAFQDTLEALQVSMYSDMTRMPDAHLELSPPHFMAAEGIPQPPFFGINILQDPLQPSTSLFSAAPVTPQSTLDPFNTSPELSSLWHQDIVTGVHGDPNLANLSSGSNASSTSNTSSPSTPSLHLTWSWTLPKLRTMSLRGPVVAYFDLQQLRFCPQLTDLALSYHCSRIPRLVYPGPATLNTRSGQGSSHFPRIMVCDSLAFKWGMNLQEDRRSLVIV
ncbi:hypothetical protein BGX27_010599 [Mortierella sp. AM989]|nr:hypothetical protein BGX27_010599 [Mortierella sp. AM989]